MANLMGVILLIGLTLVGAIAVVVAGTVALHSVADQTQDDTVEDSMREMSVRLSSVADSPVDEATSFQMEGSVNVSSATVTVTAQNSSGSPVTWERPLGTIVYDQSDGSRLAYQGGGLWDAGDGGTMVVNEPGLDFDGQTIDFSLVNVTQADAVAQNGEVVASKNVQHSRNSGREMHNQLSDAWTDSDGTVQVDMTITIESQYADGWERYARNGMTTSPDSVNRIDDTTVELVFTGIGSDTSTSGGTGTGGGTGDCSDDDDAGHGNDCGSDPDNPGSSGSEYDTAMTYDEEENALEVNQNEGDLTLLSAQIGQAVEREVTLPSEGRDPMDVSFVLDRSGSMARHCDRVEENWRGRYVCVEWSDGSDPDGERIDAVKSFVGELNSTAGDRAGAVEFNSDARVVHDLTDDFDELNDSLQNRHDGGTNIASGIDQANSQLSAGSNDEQAMILLSDGENDAWGHTQDELNEMTRDEAEEAADNNITIYTIGLGDEADQTLLEDVAQETGGQYYAVSNADELDSIFGEIADEVQTQTITQINRTRTVVTAQQDVSETLEVNGTDNVNDPGSFSNVSGTTLDYDLSNLEPGGYLSFVMTLESCDDYETTAVEQDDDDGTTYQHARCTDGGVTETTIDNGNSQHMVFRDGDSTDPLENMNLKWWHSDPVSRVDQHVQGEQFDLSPEESIIALEVDAASGQTGYVLLHFEVDEVEDGSSGGTGGSTDDSVTGGDAPSAPISIGYSEVAVS